MVFLKKGITAWETAEDVVVAGAAVAADTVIER